MIEFREGGLDIVFGELRYCPNRLAQLAEDVIQMSQIDNGYLPKAFYMPLDMIDNVHY